jgi:hypothetical protein
MLRSRTLNLAMLTDDTLIVVRSQSNALIRAELRGLEARQNLERACYEAITLLGCTVDEVSDASGLTPADLRRIVADRSTG